MAINQHYRHLNSYVLYQQVLQNAVEKDGHFQHMKKAAEISFILSPWAPYVVSVAAPAWSKQSQIESSAIQMKWSAASWKSPFMALMLNDMT